MPSAPSGNNSMGAHSSFEERNYYEFIAFLGSYFKKDQIDLRVLNLFGKVDQSGDQILLPDKRYLEDKGLLTAIDNEGEHRMLTVFAEPFISLRERFTYLKIRDAISETSSIKGLQPKKSLLSWEEEYRNHLDELSAAFFDYAIAKSTKIEVVDFKSFIKVFESFVTESCPYSVFTLKNYLMSRFCDPLVTGMMIEVGQGDASNDASKYSDFISDPNYPTLVEEAAYYGFIVDKHVPWRLVVNPSSDYMRKSLSKHGFSSLDHFFSEVYIDPTATGFEMFLRMLQRMYYHLILKSPQYMVTDHSTGASTTSVKFREKINFRNPKEIMDEMGDELTLRLYAFLRVREKNLDFSQAKFDSLVKKALDFKKQVDLKSAVVYIDDRTKEGSPSNQKLSFRI